MKYIHTTTLQQFAPPEIRAMYPHMSIPEGADLSDIGYLKIHPAVDVPKAGPGQVLVPGDPVQLDGVWRETYSLNVTPQADSRALVWERIKTERDRRKYLGVKVGAHWYHSDDPSRIQQLALAMMGAAIPAGLQWKTLTLTPPSVFVTMTPALAQGIFQSTAASDAGIFAAAEAHRMAMEASATPESYDFSGGWPMSIGDAQ